MSDGLNEYRRARVAELLCDFYGLQYIITSVPVDPDNSEDYLTEGWAAMRQCMIDGQRILDTGADTSVPGASGGSAEQEKAVLKQCYLDAFSRRHEAQKIYLRQTAAQRWIQWREQVLMGGQSHSEVNSQLRSLDQQLRSDLSIITDEYVYAELHTSDTGMGRWTAEDPSLRAVQRWVRSRRG
ncbi:hypothetical protein B0T18DRAFT_425324 [Schizothecium vesticola]|uniref:Uncharacterized protein n=1 Tax=Schizothecium vesticola TaxID=314040 RepID=A0AA40FC23_9PEZI|nr:hypothetical protein B0T18DRAFT_425324 [Schizothecium vesticola]